MNHLRWRLPIPLSMHRAAVALTLVLSTMLAVLGFTPRAHAQAPPTVNGWFYGDGDDARYAEYGTSAEGSKLYTYFDAVTNRLYVAMVISQSVNDLVCSPKSNTAYTASANPPWGTHRSCKRASDSEFAEFTLTCGNDTYTWHQALGCAQDSNPPQSNWTSDATCTSSLGGGPWPTALDIEASTSWVQNVNTYQDTYSYNPATWPLANLPWNLYAGSITLGEKDKGWKSPFVSTAPDHVQAVPGYPTFTTYEQLQAGQPNATDGWEWSMVYEWSVDVSSCPDNTVNYWPTNSHHSPAKSGGQNEPWVDWGDLPDDYPTTLADDGPRHLLAADGPYLGSTIDPEGDGKPEANADGDNNSGADDEDGVIFLGKFVSGSTVEIQVTVTDGDGTAYLSAWIDFDGDGVLEKLELASGGFVEDLALIDGVHTLTIVVPNTTIADSLAARFRLTDEAGQGGNSTTGLADNGEVEDYIVGNTALAVTLSYFYAIRNGDTVDFVWETATEMDNAGFNLYEAVDGELRLVNPELIPSTVIDSVVPVRYTYQAQVAGEVFYIDMIDIRGQSDRKGPFVLGKEYGSSSRPDVVQSLDNFIYLPLLGQ